MNFPTNVKYTNEHEWIRLEGDEAYVGITDYAQEQLGDIVFVDVTTEGETLEKGEVFGTIEVVKTVSDLFLPIGGEVLEINPELEEHPELVNKDPYGDGCPELDIRLCTHILMFFILLHSSDWFAAWLSESVPRSCVIQRTVPCPGCPDACANRLAGRL